MIPTISLVKHDPPNSYGDCLRASVASLIHKNTQDVPHFFEDGCSAEESMKRLREYLKSEGLIPFYINFPGSIPQAEILNYMKEMNPGIHYLFFGNTTYGPHVVIGLNDAIVHDTAWYRHGIIGPSDEGHWQIVVFVSDRTAG